MQILDVRTLPLSYRCEKSYMSAAGGQVARHTLLVELDPAVVERYRVQ